MTTGNALDLSKAVLVGFGITGRAVAHSLVKRSFEPSIIDDRPGADSRAAAAELGVDLIESPTWDDLERVIATATVLLPSPGVPDRHSCFALAQSHNVPIASEFDLAQMWDDRPLLAVTGTNGKTTVTELVAEALNLSGVPSLAVGNTDTPLVAAIDAQASSDEGIGTQGIDPDKVEVFVVEASSFRLGHSYRFTPDVACWLNFAPDHLDAHASLEEYLAAKASIWEHRPVAGQPSRLCIANADDETVAELAPEDAQLFSATGHSAAVWRLVGDDLVGPDGPFVQVSQLQRRQPHDIANALAVAAVAHAGGADLDSVATVLRNFTGFAHRVELVGSWQGIDWYNDSKATVPHATLSAVGGFDSVVLIAGGRNKGLDLAVLGEAGPAVRSVVAIGEAAHEVESAFAGKAEVLTAQTMRAAVEAAAKCAKSGDTVLLSPGCASFDWYDSYGQRGEEFSSLVLERHGEK